MAATSLGPTQCSSRRTEQAAGHDRFRISGIAGLRKAKALLETGHREIAPCRGDLARRKPRDPHAAEELEDERRRRRRRARQFRQPLSPLSRIFRRAARRPFCAAVRLAGRPNVSKAMSRCSGPFASGAAVEPVDELRLLSRLRPSRGILWRGRHADAGQSDRRLHARLRLFYARRPAAALGASRSIDRGRRFPTGASRRLPGSRAVSSTRSRKGETFRPASAKAIACSNSSSWRGARTIVGDSVTSAEHMSDTAFSSPAAPASSALRWSSACCATAQGARARRQFARAPRRLADVEKDIEFIGGDVRNFDTVDRGRARHGRGAPPRLRQRHANSSTARRSWCSMSA